MEICYAIAAMNLIGRSADLWELVGKENKEFIVKMWDKVLNSRTPMCPKIPTSVNEVYLENIRKADLKDGTKNTYRENTSMLDEGGYHIPLFEALMTTNPDDKNNPTIVVHGLPTPAAILKTKRPDLYRLSYLKSGDEKEDRAMARAAAGANENRRKIEIKEYKIHVEQLAEKAQEDFEIRMKEIIENPNPRPIVLISAFQIGDDLNYIYPGYRKHNIWHTMLGLFAATLKGKVNEVYPYCVGGFLTTRKAPGMGGHVFSFTCCRTKPLDEPNYIVCANFEDAIDVKDNSLPSVVSDTQYIDTLTTFFQEIYGLDHYFDMVNLVYVIPQTLS